MRCPTLVALLLLPATAGAHAILVESQPAAQSSVPAGPVHVVLRFNSRVDHARSRVVLRADGKPDAALAAESGSPADVMAAAADLAPGRYTLRWQVLAVDGHITRGDVPFTVAK